MPFFFGEYNYTLDAKGRVNIPATFRKADPRLEQSKNYIFFDEEDICLHVYTAHEFETNVVDYLKKLPTRNKDGRAYASIIGENVREVSLDKQGRITIPNNFLEKAKIKKDAKIIGAISRIEIWDPEVRKKYKDDLGGAQAKAKLEKKFLTQKESE
ncbi:cell division/cell wall cluster transcriptional repressor MraZ [candidate division KSB1 bacterium]|nr:cell division/cell wall cluster transcriptional repressor MraZ [candidate division KSB1 bacterium]MBL7092418.1 cell division/cell wall cluster transcriptional repressor MraZ [candidate division KSB1 bacterium]